MIPKISVSPAASRNSSMPSCTPLRHCSMKYSMGLGRRRTEMQGRLGQVSVRSKHDGKTGSAELPLPQSASKTCVNALMLEESLGEGGAIRHRLRAFIPSLSGGGSRNDHFIWHLPTCLSWSFSTMVATVLST